MKKCSKSNSEIRNRGKAEDLPRDRAITPEKQTSLKRLKNGPKSDVIFLPERPVIVVFHTYNSAVKGEVDKMQRKLPELTIKWMLRNSASYLGISLEKELLSLSYSEAS